jgi:hypothetical protein
MIVLSEAEITEDTLNNSVIFVMNDEPLETSDETLLSL